MSPRNTCHDLMSMKAFPQASDVDHGYLMCLHEVNGHGPECVHVFYSGSGQFYGHVSHVVIL